ncbi:MAG: hypothetical protein CL678_11350 [Bdellovibrionaceae bacterium]|nr:hypothetical protein [Pseudobdellovibrionaceae bacterium]|tara:strand:+ start:3902 stop:4492 length:591 start_codon:yes stop_codon:yes gene_type:complete
MTLLSIFLFISSSFAQDLGFRYDSQNRVCLNTRGERGFNPGYLGECGDLRGFSLRKVVLRDLNLKGALLTSASFKNRRIENVDFEGARLDRTDFSQAIVDSCSFVHSHLNRSLWRVTRVFSSLFDGAEFTRSLFFESRWSGGSYFNTFFQGSDFRNADFAFASIQSARLRGVYYNRQTRLPFDFIQARRLGMIYSR